MNRILLLATFLFVSSLTLFSQDTQLEKDIKNIIRGKKAIVGVAVIYDGNEVQRVNDMYRYPTLSVYKFHQALAVLDYLDKNNLPLDTKIYVGKYDLLPDTYSPLRDKYPNGNIELPVSELLKYSVSLSDNNACDILFKYIGGTKVVDDYIKSLGVEETSIAATEAKMNEVAENQYLNWTSPYSAAYLMDMFLRKKMFSPTYKEFLEKLLIDTETGKDKIKAMLPENVVVGHKTGTSSRIEFKIKIAENDLGFVKLPDGKQYTIAILVMNSFEDDKTNTDMIASISKCVFDYYTLRADINK